MVVLEAISNCEKEVWCGRQSVGRIEGQKEVEEIYLKNKLLLNAEWLIENLNALSPALASA